MIKLTNNNNNINIGEDSNELNLSAAMKFHHLARHNTNQFIAAAAAAAAAVAANQQQQQQDHKSIGANDHNNKVQMSDDEEEVDEFMNETRSFYENQQQQANGKMQQQQVDAGSDQPVDSSGFLIDKNKKLFPQKLWELIHNPSIQHCLRWSQDGQRVYLNRNEFEAYYLKTPNNQFHTQKAISFVRQMNMYGFRKVDDCYYENDNFRRDRQHLLRNMIRRHPNKGLFVGLDHHQLAAAAAAQQALQVNQQLQQLEQQHKQRTEQALRLNSYLNSHQHRQQPPQPAQLPHHHHHQFHQQAAAVALAHSQHHHHQLHSSGNPFEQMSSQLAQAAANHLSQQQHQLKQQQQAQLQQRQNTISNNNLNLNTDEQANNLVAAAASNFSHQASVLQTSGLHQAKKSRLLSNFYASNNNNNNQNQNNNNGLIHNQLLQNQDSMHSNSSVDSQPSQTSSAVNSGSAGSPQPNSPNALHQRIASGQRSITNGANSTNGNYTGNATGNGNGNGNSNGSQSAALRAAMLAAAGHDSHHNHLHQVVGNLGQHQRAATDLSSSQSSQRQALHQTLVRSLLQLKQNQQHDLWANLQQQQQQPNQRSLLESLASLSSAGTGSILDPTSNSPTERTISPSSAAHEEDEQEDNGRVDEPMDEATLAAVAAKYLSNNNDNMALDLAKSSSATGLKRHLNAEDIEQVDGEEEDNETEVDDEEVSERKQSANNLDVHLEGAGSPLDGNKKVRRFLDNQMEANNQQSPSDEPLPLDVAMIKSEPADDSSSHLPQRKRIKFSSNNNNNSNRSSCHEDDELQTVSSMSKSLIEEICDRRGDQLEVGALQEAARYTECFLEILLEDAALIARHSLVDTDKEVNSCDEPEAEVKKHEDEDICEDDGPKSGDDESSSNKDTNAKRPGDRGNNIVDASSLSLALKLIPSKLLAAIQQQVSIKSA